MRKQERMKRKKLASSKKENKEHQFYQVVPENPIIKRQGSHRSHSEKVPENGSLLEEHTAHHEEGQQQHRAGHHQHGHHHHHQAEAHQCQGDTPRLHQLSAHSSLDTISMFSSSSNEHIGPGSEPDYPHPQDHRSNGGHMSVGSWHPSHTPVSEHYRLAGINSAKSLSLRELALHQIGSRLSLYRNAFLGTEGGEPAAAGGGQHAKRHRRRHRSSLVFSFEDVMVDSTCVLKDCKVAMAEEVKQRRPNLNRSQSAAASTGAHPHPRVRYYSESYRRSLSSTPSTRDPAHSPLTRSFRHQISSVSRRTSEDRRSSTDEASMQKESESSQPEEEEEVAGDKFSWLRRATKYLDFKLCRRPIFLVMAGTVMTMAVGVPHTLFFIPSYAGTCGLSPSDASYLLSVSAVFDLAGRLVLGFLIDTDLFPKHLCYCSLMLTAGLSVLFLPSATTFSEIAVCVSFYGVGCGGWFLMVPLLLADYLGVENIASSYGLVRLFQSVTNLFGPLVAGLLLDRTGSAATGFYFMGGSMVLGAAIILLQPLASRKEVESQPS